MKLTHFKTILLVLSLSVIGSSCSKTPVVEGSKTAVDEGENRPRLSIEKLTTSDFASSPGAPPFPLTTVLDVRLRNDGRFPALVKDVVPEIDSRSGDCDLQLLNNKTTDLNRAILPGQVEKISIGARVQSPCKGSLSLKVTVAYSNLETKVAYTEQVVARTELSFPLPTHSPSR